MSNNINRGPRSSVSGLGTTSSLGTVWSSIIAPIKRFWEVPAIHLSTYYGTPNQLGRPGPVLAVWVERAAMLRSRAKQRLKKQQQQQQKLQAATASGTLISNPSSLSHHTVTTQTGTSFSRGSNSSPSVLSDLVGVAHSPTSARNGGVQRILKCVTSGATSTALSDDSPVPEIEGVLLVTPRAIERYQLNGLPMKRVALPDTITCFVPTKIAGVGRVFVCGTQKGRVYVLKASMFDSMLIFDTACIDRNLCQSLQRATSPAGTSSCLRSQTNVSCFTAPKKVSVFADPPRLLAEVMIHRRLTSKCYESRTSFLSDRGVARAAGDAEGGKRRPSLTSLADADGDQRAATHEAPNGQEEDLESYPALLLSCLSTLTGDGMTSALLEARANALREAQSLDVGQNAGQSLGQSLGSSRFQPVQRSVSRRGSEPRNDGDRESGIPESGNQSSTLDDHVLSGGLVDSESDLSYDEATLERDQRLMTVLQERLASRAEICSLGVKCSFSNFSETLLAGDSRGRIFAWDVPSGRLIYVFEYPKQPELARDTPCTSDFVDDSSSYAPEHDVLGGIHVAALLAIHVQKAEHHLWAGYGSGLIAVYSLATGSLVRLLRESAAIRAIELASQMAVVLTLSGNHTLTAWNSRTFVPIKSFTMDQLTSGLPITCLKIVECERRIHGSPQAILFLGCVDGSIAIQRLCWEDPVCRSRSHSTHAHLRLSDVSPAPYGAFTTMQTGFLDSVSTAPFNSIEGVYAEPPSTSGIHKASVPAQLHHAGQQELCCTLLRAFVRDAAPRCPISALWVDASLDTLFIGDASGIVATLLPIRHLFGGGIPEMPKHNGSRSSGVG